MLVQTSHRLRLPISSSSHSICPFLDSKPLASRSVVCRERRCTVNDTKACESLGADDLINVNGRASCHFRGRLYLFAGLHMSQSFASRRDVNSSELHRLILTSETIPLIHLDHLDVSDRNILPQVLFYCDCTSRCLPIHRSAWIPRGKSRDFGGAH